MDDREKKLRSSHWYQGQVIDTALSKQAGQSLNIIIPLD